MCHALFRWGGLDPPFLPQDGARFNGELADMAGRAMHCFLQASDAYPPSDDGGDLDGAEEGVIA